MHLMFIELIFLMSEMAMFGIYIMRFLIGLINIEEFTRQQECFK